MTSSLTPVLSGYNANSPEATTPVNNEYMNTVNPAIIINGFLMNGFYEPNTGKTFGPTEVGTGPLFNLPTLKSGANTARLVSYGGAGSDYWHWRVDQFFELSDPQIDLLAPNIANYAIDNNYDGVDIDIEGPNLTDEEKEKISRLVKGVRKTLDSTPTKPSYGGEYLLSFAASHIGACETTSTNESCKTILNYFKNPAQQDWLGGQVDILNEVHEDIDLINVMAYDMVPFSDTTNFEPLAKASAKSYADLLDNETGRSDGNRKIVMGVPAWNVDHDQQKLSRQTAENLADYVKDENFYGAFLWSFNYDSAKGKSNYNNQYLGSIIEDEFETHEIEAVTIKRKKKNWLGLHKNESDKLYSTVGTSKNDILASSNNKTKLEGGSGSDVFIYHGKKQYKNGKADTIIDFSTNEDSIAFSRRSLGFNAKQWEKAQIAGNELEFKSADTRKDLMKMKNQEISFIYFQENSADFGKLFYNQNGSKKGYGDGGLIVKLQGAPDLLEGNISIIA